MFGWRGPGPATAEDLRGKRDRIQPWMLYTMKPGDAHVEIPLRACDDLNWPGLAGYGSGTNMTAMKL